MSPQHAARVESSPRLQRLLHALKAAGINGVTTADLRELVGVNSVGTTVSELRRNGYRIVARRYGNGAVYVLVT